MDAAPGELLENMGTRVILPSTVTQSPRYFNQLYQDSMAMVRRYGKPDLFITMTCNPKWDEITRELLPNQVPNDRPDIIARVFMSKLTSLMDDLTNKKVIDFKKGFWKGKGPYICHRVPEKGTSACTYTNHSTGRRQASKLYRLGFHGKCRDSQCGYTTIAVRECCSAHGSWSMWYGKVTENN